MIKLSYVFSLVFYSALAVPASWILQRRAPFPNVMFGVVAKHGVTKMSVTESSTDVKLVAMNRTIVIAQSILKNKF